jgi:hypothetical protein
MTYTTRGSVRGSCGHKHRSIETAARCQLGDQKDCNQAGGYSDRQVVRVDGKDLTEGEVAHLENELDRMVNA